MESSRQRPCQVGEPVGGPNVAEIVNQAIETGGVLVANRVRIEAEVQFVRDEG